jgi:hypothetical protein
MFKTKTHSLTGTLFIVGVILLNIPYTLLIMNFNYPDILRQPTGDILTQFAAGGNALIWTWLAFAWTGFPIILGMILLPRVIDPERNQLLNTAMFLGVMASIAQMIGLLRWVFVVPVLANLYVAPASSAATKEAVVVVFQAIHQYGGVVLGEHLGQMLTILWMLLTSIALLKSRNFKPWLGWFGVIASAVYLLAQSELLATVMPAFPVVPEAGLIGSLLWLAWMIALGICLLRVKNTPAN